MIRSFIALDIPEASRQAIEELQLELKKIDAPVSWVKVSQIHLTLKFLGNIAPEQVLVIGKALEEIAASTSPFQLRPAGCGAFPSVKQMRVIWAGLHGDSQELERLHKEVQAAMSPLGFEPEDRPFRPHLTLGRVKGRRNLRPLQEILAARESFLGEPFNITEIVLYRSDLKPDGARYSALLRAPFAGRSRPMIQDPV